MKKAVFILMLLVSTSVRGQVSPPGPLSISISVFLLCVILLLALASVLINTNTERKVFIKSVLIALCLSPLIVTINWIVGFESSRELWRLLFLREWSHEQDE